MQKQGCFILIFLLFSAGATLGQADRGFTDVMSCYPKSAAPAADASYRDFLMNLSEHTPRNDRDFLRHIVAQTHKKYLKHYRASAEFPSLFHSGEFDCLTGTTLLSLILTHFGFDYSLIETNYHIFIMVHFERGNVMVESTDRARGLISGRQRIRQRIEAYKKNLAATSNPGRKIFHYRCSIYQELDPSKLPGLLYFNQAINSYNLGDWESCAEMIERSGDMYVSPRVEEIANLLIDTVSTCENVTLRKRIVYRVSRYATRSVAGL